LHQALLLLLLLLLHSLPLPLRPLFHHHLPQLLVLL
jgi:hypothetical protein